MEGMKHFTSSTIAAMVLLGCLAAPVTAQVPEAKKQAVLNYLKSGQEPGVKDAMWSTDYVLKLGMLNNGSNRDGFASYMCQELADRGIRNVTVHVIDIAKLTMTGKWVKMGEANCPN